MPNEARFNFSRSIISKQKYGFGGTLQPQLMMEKPFHSERVTVWSGFSSQLKHLLYCPFFFGGSINQWKGLQTHTCRLVLPSSGQWWTMISTRRCDSLQRSRNVDHSAWKNIPIVWFHDSGQWITSFCDLPVHQTFPLQKSGSWVTFKIVFMPQSQGTFICSELTLKVKSLW